MLERDYSTLSGQSAVSAASIDSGLRRFMIGVYNYMAGALAFTGLISFYIGQNPAFIERLATTGLMWVVLLAPLALVLFLSFRLHKMSVTTAQVVYWLYAALIGVGIAPIFMVYTQESIARTFFICALTFGGMSLYGYTTKRDLTGMGSFLIMGLWGIIIASLVNIFLHSTGLGLIISILGVLIFTGLTAYDTQRIKETYYSADNAETASKKAIMGALMLYMDFINLFLHLLRFVGDRR